SGRFGEAATSATGRRATSRWAPPAELARVHIESLFARRIAGEDTVAHSSYPIAGSLLALAAIVAACGTPPPEAKDPNSIEVVMPFEGDPINVPQAIKITPARTGAPDKGKKKK